MPVTVKGQVTIPKPIRDRLGLTPGSEVDFDLEPDGRILLRKAGQAATPNPGRAVPRGPAPGWNGMTTAEIMRLTRGED